MGSSPFVDPSLYSKFFDVTFVVDNEKFPAHKMILAGKSKYFEMLLYENPQYANKSEIEITNASPRAFRVLLQYIYKNEITITTSNVDLILDVMALARRYLLNDLESTIAENIKTIINLENVCAILNVAISCTFDDLIEHSLQYLDQHASSILASDSFKTLTQASVVKLLKRDTFRAPEMDIFNAAIAWRQTTIDVNNLVIKCVRLSCLTPVEILSVVWPTNLISDKELLNVLAEIFNIKPKTVTCRSPLCDHTSSNPERIERSISSVITEMADVNVATVDREAATIAGKEIDFLLSGSRSVSKCAFHEIGDKNGITVKLGTLARINNIGLKFPDDNNSWCYSYYIEVSIDQKKWKKVVDYSRYICRSCQNVYFDEQVVRFIRIVGTHSTQNNKLHLAYLEAYLRSVIPRTENGIICPNENVATLKKKAIITDGQGRAGSLSALLDGDNDVYTWQKIGNECIIIQLAQPYMISSIKLLLYSENNWSFRYYVETSIQKSNWQIAVDKRNEECRRLQREYFSERPVSFVRITGTSASRGHLFYCSHFECSAEER